jgi:hypothetical protein
MILKRLVLLIPLVTAACAWADDPITVGIPSESFDYVAAAQEAQDWCWAASSEMILRWFDIEVTQRDVVHRVKGRLADQPASEQDITTALTGIARLRSGKTALVRTINAAGIPHSRAILSAMEHRMPILLALDAGPGTGHTVVLTAVRYVRTPSGPQIVSLIMRDPYPSQSNIRNKGRVEISGRDLQNFVQYIKRSWIVSVTPQKPSFKAPSSKGKSNKVGDTTAYR